MTRFANQNQRRRRLVGINRADQPDALRLNPANRPVRGQLRRKHRNQPTEAGNRRPDRLRRSIAPIHGRDRRQGHNVRSPGRHTIQKFFEGLIQGMVSISPTADGKQLTDSLRTTSPPRDSGSDSMVSGSTNICTGSCRQLAKTGPLLT